MLYHLKCFLLFARSEKCFSHMDDLVFQTGGHHSENNHASHVVCGRVPLDDCERAKGIAYRSTYPYPGTPLFLL